MGIVYYSDKIDNQFKSRLVVILLQEYWRKKQKTQSYMARVTRMANILHRKGLGILCVLFCVRTK